MDVGYRNAFTTKSTVSTRIECAACLNLRLTAVVSNLHHKNQLHCYLRPWVWTERHTLSHHTSFSGCRYCQPLNRAAANSQTAAAEWKQERGTDAADEQVRAGVHGWMCVYHTREHNSMSSNIVHGRMCDLRGASVPAPLAVRCNLWRYVYMRGACMRVVFAASSSAHFLRFPLPLRLITCTLCLQECMYNLFAVICHKGDMTGGHYVVYVHSWGGWFCCDDAYVTLVQVGLHEVAWGAWRGMGHRVDGLMVGSLH